MIVQPGIHMPNTSSGTPVTVADEHTVGLEWTRDLLWQTSCNSVPHAVWVSSTCAFCKIVRRQMCGLETELRCPCPACKKPWFPCSTVLCWYTSATSALREDGIQGHLLHTNFKVSYVTAGLNKTPALEGRRCSCYP